MKLIGLVSKSNAFSPKQDKQNSQNFIPENKKSIHYSTCNHVSSALTDLIYTSPRKVPLMSAPH